MSKSILYFDKVFDELKEMMLEYKPKNFDLYFWKEMDDNEREERLKKADYLMVAGEKVGEDIFARANNAKFVQKTGMGVDNIDVQAAAKHHLPVCNSPGGNAAGVAELTILLILSLYRKLPFVNEATKKGQWLMWELRPSSYEMQGKTHGFIGFGNIGREAAKRSRAFGTNIVYYDQYRRSETIEKELEATYMSFEDVLKTSDIISLHVPLLPETRGIIGYPELEKMKSNAIIINVSRGGIVVEKDLYDALNRKVIAGGGIDVWENEPTEPANPLFQLNNVIATPHIGAGTRDTLDKVFQIAFGNIVKVENQLSPDYIVNDIREARLNGHVPSRMK